MEPSPADPAAQTLSRQMRRANDNPAVREIAASGCFNQK
jgi:hypothetical protein